MKTLLADAKKSYKAQSMVLIRFHTVNPNDKNDVKLAYRFKRLYLCSLSKYSLIKITESTYLLLLDRKDNPQIEEMYDVALKRALNFLSYNSFVKDNTLTIPAINWAYYKYPVATFQVNYQKVENLLYQALDQGPNTSLLDVSLNSYETQTQTINMSVLKSVKQTTN